jgi:hypothetical protein
MATIVLLRVGLVVGLIGLFVGLGLAGGSAVVAGDWWLARQPWIGWGLALILAGLLVFGVSAIALDAVAPVGWLRLLAVPPAVLVAVGWILVVLVAAGVGSTGAYVANAPPRSFDLATAMYSKPEYLVALVVGTLGLASPLLVARLRRR